MNCSDIQVVILAGGRGTRLKPLTDNIPKPMMKIGTKPFLEIIIQLLKKNNFRRFVFLVGHLSNIVTDYFGNGSKFDVEIQYSFEKELLGTGGSLRNSYDLLDEKFILLNGDTYMELDYPAFVHYASNKNSMITIVSYDGPKFDYTPYNLRIDENDFIRDFSQMNIKPEFNAINTGIYYFNKSILNHFPQGKSSLELDLMPKLIEKNAIAAFRTKEKFYDIGTFNRLQLFRNLS